jgi:hypothetical protein
LGYTYASVRGHVMHTVHGGSDENDWSSSESEDASTSVDWDGTDANFSYSGTSSTSDSDNSSIDFSSDVSDDEASAWSDTIGTSFFADIFGADSSESTDQDDTASDWSEGLVYVDLASQPIVATHRGHMHTQNPTQNLVKPEPGGELQSWDLKEDLPWERVESALRSDLATLPPRPVCMQGLMGMFVEHEKKIRPRRSELNDFRVDKWFQSGGKKGSTLMPTYGVPHIRRKYGRVLRTDGRQHKVAVYELVGTDDPELSQRRLYHVMPVIPKRQYAARDTTADPEIKNKKHSRDAKRAKLAGIAAATVLVVVTALSHITQLRVPPQNWGACGTGQVPDVVTGICMACPDRTFSVKGTECERCFTCRGGEWPMVPCSRHVDTVCSKWEPISVERPTSVPPQRATFWRSGNVIFAFGGLLRSAENSNQRSRWNLAVLGGSDSEGRKPLRDGWPRTDGLSPVASRYGASSILWQLVDVSHSRISQWKQYNGPPPTSTTLSDGSALDGMVAWPRSRIDAAAWAASGGASSFLFGGYSETCFAELAVVCGFSNDVHEYTVATEKQDGEQAHTHSAQTKDRGVSFTSLNTASGSTCGIKVDALSRSRRRLANTVGSPNDSGSVATAGFGGLTLAPSGFYINASAAWDPHSRWDGGSATVESRPTVLFNYNTSTSSREPATSIWLPPNDMWLLDAETVLWTHVGGSRDWLYLDTMDASQTLNTYGSSFSASNLNPGPGPPGILKRPQHFPQ